LTTDENQTDALIRACSEKLIENFPRRKILVRGIDQGPPVEAPLEVRLFGPSTDLLKVTGRTISPAHGGSAGCHAHQSLHGTRTT